jgi:hypothetical protein
MKTLVKIFTAFMLFVAPFTGVAQNDVPMADELRSSGKIYVVVAILLVILIGLLIYVLVVDRKITRLEKKLDEK